MLSINNKNEIKKIFGGSDDFTAVFFSSTFFIPYESHHTKSEY